MAEAISLGIQRPTKTKWLAIEKRDVELSGQNMQPLPLPAKLRESVTTPRSRALPAVFCFGFPGATDPLSPPGCGPQLPPNPKPLGPVCDVR